MFDRGEFEAGGHRHWDLGLELADVVQVRTGRSGQQLESDRHDNGLQDILRDGEIIKRPPVQHRFNRREILAVHTVIDGADRGAAFGHEDREHTSIGVFPFQAFLWIVEPIPDDRGWSRIIELVTGQQQVTLRVPLSVFGDKFDPAKSGYAAMVMSQDGFPAQGVWRVRDVDPVASQWRLGGSPGDINHTRIIDLVRPADAAPTQEEALGKYPSTVSGDIDKLTPDDFAIVPLLLAK